MDESGLTDYLHGEVAQTFIDDVYEVRPRIPSLPRIGLITIAPSPSILPFKPIRLWILPTFRRGSGGSA